MFSDLLIGLELSVVPVIVEELNQESLARGVKFVRVGVPVDGYEAVVLPPLIVFLIRFIIIFKLGIWRHKLHVVI